MGTMINVITVCGSGAVSSTMLAAGVTDILEAEGYSVNATETMPNSLENLLLGSPCDLIVTSTDLEGLLDEDIAIPVIDGIGLLTGRGVDQVKEEILKALQEMGKLPD